MKHRRRIAAAAAWLAMAAGCGADSCAFMEPIPGGFPAEDRIPNAIQVRVSSHGLASITADPAGLLSGLIGDAMGLSFDIPPTCAANDNPAICCEPVDGPIVDPCGPLQIDLDEQPGDAPRVEITPGEGAARVDISVRARISTVSDIAIWYDTGLFFDVHCGVQLNTEAAGPNDDILVTAAIVFEQDPVSGTTRVVTEAVSVTQLDDGDLTLTGSFLCDFANVLTASFMDALVTGLEETLRSTIQDTLCKPCPGGDVGQCGEFATACQNDICMSGAECLQEMGASGRLLAAAALGGLSPGQAGAVDMYIVGGGHATTDDGGISLGILGGAIPGEPESRCGPAADVPVSVSVPRSSFFEGNSRPDTSTEFDLALGVHQHEIDQFAWAAYEGGLLCMNIGTDSVELLNSDTMALVMPSLLELLHGTTARLVLGLRPQQPPTIRLGPGSFTPEGDIDEPLLDITLPGLEIDFFAMVDEQYIRVMTVSTDVALPVSLEVSPMGELQPVLGDVDNAFTNFTVTNSKALLETPEELAERLPAVLAVALPFLGDGIAPIALPNVGGLTLAVQNDGITTIEDETFLAIFADFDTTADPVSPRIVTSAEIAAVHVPQRHAFLGTGFDRSQRPAIELTMDGRYTDGRRADVEFSYRLNNSMWSPYKRGRQIRVSRDDLWLIGSHSLEVRAREVGKALTADLTPVALTAIVDTTPSLRPARAGSPAPEIRDRLGFHGRTSSDSAGGCGCRVGGRAASGGSTGALLVLLAAAVHLARRRRLWAVALVAAALVMPAGCSCGSSSSGPCGPIECLDGEVEPGPTGRYSDMAAGEQRLVISAFDETLGDLVLLDVASDGTMTAQVIDGAPDDTSPVYPPDTYRGGIAEPGDAVGTWTSVGLYEDRAHIAYHDIDEGALRYAREGRDGWSLHVVDDDASSIIGTHTSLAFDRSGFPAIAYMATAIDDGSGGLRSEVRFAKASTATPSASADWEITILDQASIPCTGFCGDGACVAETLQCETIATSCAAECASQQECVAGTCVDVLRWVAHDIAEGVGLFSDIAYLPDGRAVVVYYDRTLGTLVVQHKASNWTREVLDVGATGDAGMWASLGVDIAGTVHIAYQDARRDHLMYTTWQDGAQGSVTTVDDGSREGQRVHHVGAGAKLIVDGEGQPAIVYQDAEDAALRIARRESSGTWSHRELIVGADVLGFHNSLAVRDHSIWVSTYAYERDVFPPGVLQITNLP